MAWPDTRAPRIAHAYVNRTRCSTRETRAAKSVRSASTMLSWFGGWRTGVWRPADLGHLRAGFAFLNIAGKRRAGSHVRPTE